MKDKKRLLLVIGALLSVIVITVGVSFAFFNYAKLGSTENSITTGTITFLYTEVDKVGAGIKLENAIPITDTAGKMLTGSGNVFNFKVTSTTNMNASIPYEVTARMKKDSTLDKDVVKVYLTKGETEEEILLDKYSNLTQTERVAESVAIEKTIYTGKVPSNTSNYEETFKLRMWIDEKTDFSPVEENGKVVYPYNNKTFTLMVNVYADAKVVTQEDVDIENSTKIETVTAGDTTLTEVTGEDYQYEVTLPEGTTSTTLNVETANPNAKVEIEKVDGLASANNIQRLATTKTVSLTSGNNYFKVIVISENNEVTDECLINIKVAEKLSQAIFNTYSTIYTNPTLTSSSNNTNDVSGLYKSTLTNSGDPTYYFRGNVENNYVDFAGFAWRIVRINEDGTIRLIMQDGINNSGSALNSDNFIKDNMYYSNSNMVKQLLEDWYNINITEKNLFNNVATGEYFCEQGKIARTSNYITNSGTNMIVYSDYKIPNFKCEKDGNDKDLVNSGIGLISYDEILHAGGYQGQSNSIYYLNNNSNSWSMSPAGVNAVNGASEWYIGSDGSIKDGVVNNNTRILRPVINLKSTVAVTGTGASDDHWVVAN